MPFFALSWKKKRYGYLGWWWVQVLHLNLRYNCKENVWCYEHLKEELSC